MSEKKIIMNNAQPCGEILIKMGGTQDGIGGDFWGEPLASSDRLFRIIISYDSHAVNSIQLTYQRDKEVVVAEKHGGDGSNFDIIEFSCGEHLTSISGQSDQKKIHGLCFRTNFRTYGPFSDTNIFFEDFNYNFGNKFGGFHGRSSDGFLHALGVYVRSGASRTWSSSLPSSSNLLTA